MRARFIKSLRLRVSSMNVLKFKINVLTLQDMDRATYERQKMFAGEKKPSMQRRCIGHDYTARGMYMITMVTEGRRPLFGRVEGHSEAPPDSIDAPRMVLSELGQKVSEEWNAITGYHPVISVISLQMMPDHLHGILFVRQKLDRQLGYILRGFKQSCNKHYRKLVLGLPSAAPVSAAPSVALSTQPTTAPKKDRRGEDRTHGMLFARGYNDKILLRDGQLENWLRYLRDNPRRLLMKREHPDFFRVQRGLTIGEQSFSAIGNRFLLSRPLRIQVQCSRKMTEQQIEAKTVECLTMASQGAVLVSPCISKGEKQIMRAAFDRGLPLIILQENGFTDLAKPGSKRMEACARGQLLLLAPWQHHNEKLPISRSQCLALNELARIICQDV